MGIIQSETNRGKKSVIFDDHIQIVKCFKEWRQIVQMYPKQCNARIRTGADSKTTVKTLNEHNHGVDMSKGDNMFIEGCYYLIERNVYATFRRVSPLVYDFE